MGPPTLQAALDGADVHHVETSECMDGSTMLRFDGMLDYAVLQRWMQKNDCELQMTRLGDLILRAVRESARTDSEKIDADTTSVVEAGPIFQHRHTGVFTCSSTLDTILRKPSVLKIMIGQTCVHVDELKPSIVKNGIAHLKRRGQIRPRTSRGVWPATSATQRRAACARKRSAGLLSRLWK